MKRFFFTLICVILTIQFAKAQGEIYSSFSFGSKIPLNTLNENHKLGFGTYASVLYMIDFDIAAGISLNGTQFKYDNSKDKTEFIGISGVFEYHFWEDGPWFGDKGLYLGAEIGGFLNRDKINSTYSKATGVIYGFTPILGYNIGPIFVNAKYHYLTSKQMWYSINFGFTFELFEF